MLNNDPMLYDSVDDLESPADFKGTENEEQGFDQVDLRVRHKQLKRDLKYRGSTLGDGAIPLDS